MDAKTTKLLLVNLATALNATANGKGLASVPASAPQSAVEETTAEIEETPAKKTTKKRTTKKEKPPVKEKAAEVESSEFEDADGGDEFGETKTYEKTEVFTALKKLAKENGSAAAVKILQSVAKVKKMDDVDPKFYGQIMDELDDKYKA